MEIKTAMILAAGRGERMLPLSQHLPKPLFEVAGTTLIGRHLERLSHAGIETVVINVHYLAEQIIQALGQESFGMQILYSQESELLETAGGIQAALPLLGTGPFLVVNGDVYTDFCFEDFLHNVDVTKLPRLVMVPNPEHHPLGDFSVDEVGLLRSGGPTAMTYSGIGIYQEDFFAGLSTQKRMLRELFDKAVAEGRLYGEVYSGFWSDVGTPERYEALKAQAQ